MTRPRDRVRQHLSHLRGATLLVATVSTLPSVVACDPAPHPYVVPSADRSSAQIGEDGAVRVTLVLPPGWKVKELRVENAKLENRGEGEPLILDLRRSQPGVGETAVLGGDEPIRLEATIVEPNGIKHPTLFEVATAGAQPGATVPVTQPL